MKKICLLFCCCLFVLSVSFSAAPQSFKYQAILRDNSGVVIGNRNVSIRLSILKTTSSGTAVYTETQTVTSTSLGLINIEIGKGTPTFGNMQTIDWSNDNYFIKIEMDDNGGTSYTLVGTSQLVSVPYALFANKASNGTQWKDSSNNIYYNAGRVGIGTAVPKSSLEVRSSSACRVTITGNIPSIRFTDTAYSGNGVVIGVAADSNNLIPRSGHGDLVFTNEAYGTGGGYIFGTGVPSQACVKITNDCKVGIGTDAPVSKLDVKGGDVNIEDIGSGVIMKSPDGNCWRLTVNNSGQTVVTSINCLSAGTVHITPTDWVLHYFEGSAGNDVFYAPGSFIKSGTASFGTLPHTSGHWFSEYTINIPQEINLDLNSDSLKLVANVRNVNGDGTSNEVDLGLRNDSSVYAAWQKQSAFLPFCLIQIGSKQTANISEQLLDPTNYGEYALQVQNNTISTLKNNVLLKSVSNTASRGGRVKYINVSFRGYGEVDWVKLYKGSKLIMIENFNTDGTTTAVWTMP